jgi:hypothetical protein
MTASKAMQIVKTFGPDAYFFFHHDGETVHEMASRLGAVTTTRGAVSRYSFSDGSAIIDMDAGWDVRHPDCTCGWCASEKECLEAYSVRIFDADPQLCGTELENAEVDARNTDEATEEAFYRLQTAAAACSPEDGYEIGDVLYAQVCDPTGEFVAELRHELTAEDLGVEE